MADQQVVHENGRVSATFKTVLGIFAALFTAGVIGIFNLNQKVSDLGTQITIQGLEYRNDYSRLDDRISQLEREHRRDRDDNREQ